MFYRIFRRSTDDDLQKETFLSTPLLFRFGPLALGGIAIALIILLVFVNLSRIQARLQTDYSSVFDDINNRSLLIGGNLDQIVSRIRQSAQEFDSGVNPENLKEIEAHIKSNADGLTDIVSHSVAYSSTGSQVASSQQIEQGDALASYAAGIFLKRTPTESSFVVLPSIIRPNEQPLVPVVVSVMNPGTVNFMVFLMKETVITAQAMMVFKRDDGFFRVLNSDGELIINIRAKNRIDYHGVEPDGAIVTSSEDALKQDTSIYDRKSNVLMSRGFKGSNGLTTFVGLDEESIASAIRRRVLEGWFGIILVGLFGAVASCMVAVAIRQFSKKERYLRRLATTDALTGLKNRRSFYAILGEGVKKTQEEGGSLAIFFIDLDNFKFVNDSIGHTKGDSLLKHIAHVLTVTAPPGACICRIGGDEFTILISGLDSAMDAKALGTKILNGIRTSAVIDGIPMRSRASIGVALMPMHANTLDDFIQHADTALHRAKSSGKSQCVIYDEEMASQAHTHAVLIADLESAVNGTGLRLAYQAQFSLEDGTVTGFEALLRWHHPTRGEMCPAKFSHIAEAAGLIREIGQWVILAAVGQIKEWHALHGIWVSVAVNVSIHQLRDDTFIQNIANVLSAAKVPGKYLQVEITERATAIDSPYAKEIIEELYKLGVSIAIDNIGTGPTALGSLPSLAVHTLKIDQSFIEKMATPEGSAFCLAVITMGRTLNMRVVAKGVETRHQCQALRRMGCNDVQGNLCSKPMPADEAIRLKPQDFSWLQPYDHMISKMVALTRQ